VGLWCRGSRGGRATGGVSPVSRARGGSVGHPERCGCGSERGDRDTIRPSVVSYRLYSLLIVACRRARFARSPHDSLAMQVKRTLLHVRVVPRGLGPRAARTRACTAGPTWCDVHSSPGGVSKPFTYTYYPHPHRIQPTKSTSFGWHPSAERGRAPGLCALWRRASRSPPTAPSAAAAASAGPLPSMAPRSSQSLEQVELW